VVQGDLSPAIRAALVDRERQIAEITARLLAARPDSMQSKLQGIRKLVQAEMR
jgi:hypothetical protein